MNSKMEKDVVGWYGKSDSGGDAVEESVVLGNDSPRPPTGIVDSCLVVSGSGRVVVKSKPDVIVAAFKSTNDVEFSLVPVSPLDSAFESGIEDVIVEPVSIIGEASWEVVDVSIEVSVFDAVEVSSRLSLGTSEEDVDELLNHPETVCPMEVSMEGPVDSSGDDTVVSSTFGKVVGSVASEGSVA